jgi:hypothetical protein
MTPKELVLTEERSNGQYWSRGRVFAMQEEAIAKVAKNS